MVKINGVISQKNVFEVLGKKIKVTVLKVLNSQTNKSEKNINLYPYNNQIQKVIDFLRLNDSVSVEGNWIYHNRFTNEFRVERIQVLKSNNKKIIDNLVKILSVTEKIRNRCSNKRLENQLKFDFKKYLGKIDSQNLDY